MACECASVKSRVSGNVELVRDGDTGLILEPGDVRGFAADQLQLLISDPSLRRSVARRACEQIASKFSLETSAKR